MAAEHYRSAELVFGWSFYRQGSSGGTSSADEFLDVALAWFGDPDPRIGTPWEKGERLANLIAHRRTLLVLDGLEPLQNPPGSQEGRIRDRSLQALLRELAAFNTGLCVITTRLPVADIADHERTSAPRRDLEQLSSDAGARLLGALGVKGHEAELRSASDEFRGHCLALTLLGSYLSDAYNGDIRYRKEVSERLAHDVRQGVHARKVMESYQTWLGEGPELSVLRMLGLFDRPADETALETLLKPPAIRGLTESLINLSSTEWRTIIARLRRAKLLAGQDPHDPGHLDTHPLVREYFGEQLRSQRTDAWKECNRRLYSHYRAIAPQLPDSFRDMEPLFLAVICGCNAGLFHDALHEVYIPRIQRGNASFTGNVLGARGALLSVLIHFFEHGNWKSPLEHRPRRAAPHCGRSALHPHADWDLSNGHARTFGIGGANLLRAGGVSLSLRQSSAAPVCGTGRSMALFPHNRQTDYNDAACRQSLLPGTEAERLCAIDRSLPRLGSHALLFRQFRISATIRGTWCSDLAPGRRRIPSRRARRARNHLSVP